jgi:thiol-disulfide isomerase/thioredoxin
MKSKTSRNLLLLAAALAAFAAGYFTALWLRAPATDTGGGQAIEFRLPDLTGKEHGLDEWRGQVVVLNFWATWCPPCREEIPIFIDLQKRLGGKGLQFVGIAIDDASAVASYQREVGINYPNLLGGDGGLGLMSAYGNTAGGLPFTVILDRDGRIAAHKVGAFRRVELEALLSPLLTQKAQNKQ